MRETPEHNKRMANLTLAGVYPHYVNKIESKGGVKEDLDKAIGWLTGFTDKEVAKFIEDKSTFSEFFEKANLNADSVMITGSICGYKIQDIENDLTRSIRCLDKLVDEISKGKPIDKVLRRKDA